MTAVGCFVGAPDSQKSMCGMAIRWLFVDFHAVEVAEFFVLERPIDLAAQVQRGRAGTRFEFGKQKRCLRKQKK